MNFEDVVCPHCGDEPLNVAEASREADLVALGYLHRDVRLHCAAGHTWTHGVPDGEPETVDRWTCDACGGRYTPRDVAHGIDDTIQVVVKCRDCYYRPDRPLRFPIPDEDTGNNEWRILLGHPDVCGNTEEATPHGALLTT